MRLRIGFLAVSIAVVASACAGSTDEPTSTTAVAAAQGTSVTTTSAASTTTVETAAGGDTEFCQLMSVQDTAMETVDIFDPASVEKAYKESLDAIHQARDLVPPDIRAEYDLLVAAFEGFAAALEENGWAVLALAEDDPRLVRMSSDEVLAATNSLISYCGLETAAADTGGGTQLPPLAGDLPDELMPPGAVFMGDTSGITILSSTASYDDTVAFYEAALGSAPVNVEGAAGDRVASFLTTGVLVQVTEGGTELLIYITLTG